MNKRLVILLVSGVLSLPRVVLAQPEGEPLTLSQAISLALENHPSLKVAEANMRSAGGVLSQARSVYMPSLCAVGTAQRNGGAFVLNPSVSARSQTYNTYTGGFQATQTLIDFGKTVSRVSASSGFYDASSLDYDASRAEVVLGVQIAYFGVIQAQQVVRVDERAVDQSAKHLAQAEAFYKVGTRPLLDVMKAEVDLANANVNLIQARNKLRVANVQLENALGTYPRSPYVIRDSLTIAPFPMTLDSVKSVAFAQRPELLAAETRVDANRSLVSAAWDQHLPTLSAFGSWMWSNFDFPLFNRWNAGVTLTFPLFQGFSVVGQVDQAQAAADAAQAEYELLKESVVLEVEQAYLGLREAEERLAATSKLVEEAEQSLVLAERQYAAGVGTVLDVTDAELSLSNAHITLIQGLYDYNSSFATLQKAMGMVVR